MTLLKKKQCWKYTLPFSTLTLDFRKDVVIAWKFSVGSNRAECATRFCMEASNKGESMCMVGRHGVGGEGRKGGWTSISVQILIGPSPIWGWRFVHLFTLCETRRGDNTQTHGQWEQIFYPPPPTSFLLSFRGWTVTNLRDKPSSSSLWSRHQMKIGLNCSDPPLLFLSVTNSNWINLTKDYTFISL